jgi:hypothetical protein
MPELRVSVVLPYYLRLEPDDYQLGRTGDVIQVLEPLLDEATPPRTPLRAPFSPEESADPEEVQRLRVRCAEQFLTRSNRLLRWYRAVSRRADIIELTRAQVSPFEFSAAGPAAPEWLTPLQYEQPPPPVHLDALQTTAAVREGLATGEDPGVADLFLLDAERALQQGRFREAVLFCWSTIDSVFNQKYDALVEVALAGEWARARSFFQGTDFGLRNKMSAVMHLVANRSLFREPDHLWERLSESYDRRNAIIHRAENATENEARQAVDVARRLVSLMNSIPVPGPQPEPGPAPPPQGGAPAAPDRKRSRKKGK